MENHEAWSLLCKRLKDVDFSLESIKLVKVDLAELVVSSPTPSTLMRVKDKFLPLIAKTWNELTGENVTVKAIKRDAARAAKVVDDGELLKRRPVAAKKTLLAVRPPAPSVLPVISPSGPTADERLEKAMARLPEDLRRRAIEVAIKEHYNLGDTKFTSPTLLDKYREPRAMAIYLSKTYRNTKGNSELAAYFGITQNSLESNYKRGRRASTSDPNFKRALRAIKDSLMVVCGLKP